MTDRRSLHEKIDKLDSPETAVVEKVVDAELIAIETSFQPGSWLASPKWVEGFGARLRAHHALNPEPLVTSAFEAAFNGACDVAGYDVAPAVSAVHRFFDTTVEGDDGTVRRISLKSSAAKDLKEATLHISKLTEAAWIQDARKQKDRHTWLKDLFRDYRDSTDAILQLRCFRVDDGYRYQLVEVPTSMFEAVDELTVAAAQAGTINFPPGTTWRDRTFALRVDKSDAKLTVTGIRIDGCTVHGEWTVPNLSGVEAEAPDDDDE